MKKFVFLMLIVCALFACEDEQMKTPGELNGEKINELVGKYGLEKIYCIQSEASGSAYYSPVSFYVEGQYLYCLDSYNSPSIYNLNRIVKIECNVESQPKMLLLSFD